MHKNLKNARKPVAYGVGLGAFLAASASQAAAVDVTSVTTVITDVTTAAGTIGLAVLAMHYGIKAYKWIKGAG